MANAVADQHPWAAVFSVAFGTFALVTSEFLPIGLLSHIAKDFDVLPGQVGILVTTPGVVAAISAPMLSIAAGRLDRRILLIGFTLLVLLSNLMVASAGTFGQAIAGRALLGMSVGGLWTFAAAVGRKLVDEASGNRATSIIIGGISVGTVVGVPLGSILGSVEGWRFAFYVVSFLCFCVLIAQAVFLPKIINSTAQTVKGLLDVFRNKGLILAFAAAALAAGGHFTAYTYLEPHLVDAGADAVELAWLLALYGAAGVAGTFIGERLGTSKPAMGFFIVATAMAVSILMTVEFEGNLVALAFAVGLWGLSFGAVPVCVQIWTYATDPERFETSSALTVSVFQIALAAGSFLGGTLVNNIGVPSAFFSGASLNLLCAVVLGVALFRQLQTRIEK